MTSVKWIFFSDHSQNTTEITIFLGTQMLNLLGGLDSRKLKTLITFVYTNINVKYMAVTLKYNEIS